MIYYGQSSRSAPPAGETQFRKHLEFIEIEDR